MAEAPRSPNHGDRRGGARPDIVLIHYTAMDEAGALGKMCDPAEEVSAHWFVAEDGRTIALVDEERRAWHAGASYWAGDRDVNSRSIGIELCNDGTAPYPAAQVEALVALLGGIVARWGVPPERVLGHSDVAPGRKRDPGPRFPWALLAAKGLAVVPPNRKALPDEARFRAALERAGYDPDCGTEVLVEALRLRAGRAVEGPLDAYDMGAALALAARWPAATGDDGAGRGPEPGIDPVTARG